MGGGDIRAAFHPVEECYSHILVPTALLKNFKYVCNPIHCAYAYGPVSLKAVPGRLLVCATHLTASPFLSAGPFSTLDALPHSDSPGGGRFKGSDVIFGLDENYLVPNFLARPCPTPVELRYLSTPNLRTGDYLSMASLTISDSARQRTRIVAPDNSLLCLVRAAWKAPTRCAGACGSQECDIPGPRY